MSPQQDVTGFIKYKNQIGLYRADYEAWILDARAYCTHIRTPEAELLKRKDGRFTPKTLCPIRKDDVAQFMEWFEANAAVNPNQLQAELEKLDYIELDSAYEDFLPVVFYDFDELTSFENPDLNAFTPYDDFLPEGWTSVVVEGFDALVPATFFFWAKPAARLECRSENTL